MDMRGALRARLLGNAPIAALVATRITWLARPQATGLPAITLQLVSGEHGQHLRGFEKPQARVQLDAWAVKHADATALIVAAKSLAPGGVYEGVRFGHMFFGGEIDFIDRLGTADIYRVKIDLIFDHEPA